MYADEIVMYALGIVGILSFILMTGFVEGGNLIAAVVCLAIMFTAFHIGLFIDGKKAKRKR